MRKGVATAVVALLTGALMLPGHEASARSGGGHSGFGGYGYDHGYGRAFAYGLYGYRAWQWILRWVRGVQLRPVCRLL
jgi:hypothetical protein